MPWEWKKAQNMNKFKPPRPKSSTTSPNQPPKPGSAPGDDYDEPWENKQGYLLQNQLGGPGAGKSRSPAPLPRSLVAASTGSQEAQLYERPWDPAQANNSNNPVEQVPSSAYYETPWENVPGNQVNVSNTTKDSSPGRVSQPCMPPAADSTNYDTPWEYKTAKQFVATTVPKPPRLSDDATEVNPDLPLDAQR